MLLILPAFTRRPSLVTGCHSFSSLLAPRRGPRRPPRPRPRSPPRSPPREANPPLSAILYVVGCLGRVVVGRGGRAQRSMSASAKVWLRLWATLGSEFGRTGWWDGAIRAGWLAVGGLCAPDLMPEACKRQHFSSIGYYQVLHLCTLPHTAHDSLVQVTAAGLDQLPCITEHCDPFQSSSFPHDHERCRGLRVPELSIPLSPATPSRPALFYKEPPASRYLRFLTPMLLPGRQCQISCSL